MNEALLHDAHSIFCEVFQTQMPYETFRHKHMDNPYLDPELAVLVDYQDDIPAGTNSFTRYSLLNNSQCMLVIHSCDTAVKSAYRGRHIFSLLIQQAISACQKNETSLVLAAPNQNSYPGFQKLGFHEVGKLDTYAAVVRPVHLLLRKILHHAPSLPPFQEETFSSPEGEWTLSLRCPFTEGDFAKMNARPGIHLQRSLAFYQWKVDYLPEGKAAYLCAWKKGRLQAFFILRRHSGGSCTVCDWLLPEDKELAKRLLKKAVRLLRPYCDLLNISMVSPEGEEAVQLTSGGFSPKKGWRQPFMIYPTADIDEEARTQLQDLRNWTLRYIDGDTILNG